MNPSQDTPYEVAVDIVHIPRILRLIQQYHHRLGELFTPEELRYAFSRKRPEVHLAARFAAKEATAKILGVRPRFREVEVGRDLGGKPFLRVSGKFAALSSSWELRLSLTHDGEYAIAVVLGVRKGRELAP